jgi:hypothetical protein
VRHVGQLRGGSPRQGVSDKWSEQAPVKGRDQIEVRPPNKLAQADVSAMPDRECDRPKRGGDGHDYP